MAGGASGPGALSQTLMTELVPLPAETQERDGVSQYHCRQAALLKQPAAARSRLQ